MFPILGLSMNRNVLIAIIMLKGLERSVVLRINSIYLKILDHSLILNTLIVILHYGRVRIPTRNKMKWRVRINTYIIR